jgi:hypothetical protein
MRVADKIAICTTNMHGEPLEQPRLELKDDEGWTMASVDMSELAEALAPYLQLQPKKRE